MAREIKNLKRLAYPFLVALLWSSSAANAVQLVNFDSLTGTPLEAADAFQSQGVVFESLFVIDVSASAFYLTGPGSVTVTLPNVASLNTGLSLIATARFVDPASGLPATTNHVEFDVFDTEVGTSGIVVTAFDIAGSVLFTENFITPPEQFFTVSVNVPGINRLVMVSDNDGNGVDNFRFNDVSGGPSVPVLQPVAMALITVLLFGCAVSAILPPRPARLSPPPWMESIE